MFWHRKLWLGPIHFSLVRNEPMAQFATKRVGGFLAWDRRWLCATLRIASVYLNLDVDLR